MEKIPFALLFCFVLFYKKGGVFSTNQSENLKQYKLEQIASGHQFNSLKPPQQPQRLLSYTYYLRASMYVPQSPPQVVSSGSYGEFFGIKVSFLQALM
jgi:hypothetical protein